MKKKTLLYLKMIAFVVILVILDQISKFVATANLMGKSKYIVIKGLLSFNYLEGGNKGAAWGIFSGKILMFVIITIIAIVIISIFMRNITGIMCNEGKSATLMVLQYTFGMLMAGAVGNLIDRVVNGSVVDFICFEFIDFPIFNVADCYVTVLQIHVCRVFRHKETTENTGKYDDCKNTSGNDNSIIFFRFFHFLHLIPDLPFLSFLSLSFSDRSIH